jgi:hypothetical protein
MLATVVVGCGGTDQKPSTGQLEREIRGEFERGAAEQNQAGVSDSDNLTIEDVSCVRKNDSEATCRVVGGGGRDEFGLPADPEALDLVVDIDPDTGRYQWRVQQ